LGVGRTGNNTLGETRKEPRGRKKDFRGGKSNLREKETKEPQLPIRKICSREDIPTLTRRGNRQESVPVSLERRRTCYIEGRKSWRNVCPEKRRTRREKRSFFAYRGGKKGQYEERKIQPSHLQQGSLLQKYPKKKARSRSVERGRGNQKRKVPIRLWTISDRKRSQFGGTIKKKRGSVVPWTAKESFNHARLNLIRNERGREASQGKK